MKIRTDFVTNSSSSSFIIARKSELNDKQKELIIQYVEENFLGVKVLTPESSEEEIQKVFEDDYKFSEEQEEIREALANGLSIYHDVVSFEEGEYVLSKLYEDLWWILENNGDGTFKAIDDDMSY